MIDIKKVKDFFDGDLFVKHCDIEITDAKEAYCECRMKISDKHLNAGGVIQGGAIYTIADFTFAVAANCDGKATVTHNTNITYLKPGKSKYLVARANKLSCGKSTCLYEVKVLDDNEVCIAYATVSGFIKGERDFK